MKRIFAILLFSMTALMTQAQSPRVQVIHNSPDAAADTVDIWINGSKEVDNLAFREATPFVTLSAGNNNVGIAPKNSTVITDTIANFTYNLMSGSTYIIVADGTLSGSPSYSPFQPFGLNVYAMAREAATNGSNVDLLVHHGSTDAPTVDVRGQDPSTVLVNDAPYGAFSGYLSLSEDDYIIRITDASGATIVASYEAPLEALNLEGKAITVVASGFLTPANNSNGPAFGLYVALASGGQLIALPSAAAPRVQVIHNCADAAAATVDVWINGSKAVDDLDFREATAYVSLNTGLNRVGVAPSNSTVITDTIANFDLNLLAGNTYIAVANGIVSPSGYSPATPFGLSIYDMARESANISTEIDVLVHHGSTDAPTVDVRGADTATVLVNDAPYGAFSGYLSLPEDDYTIRITDASGATVVQSYIAPLQSLNLAGTSITVVASGFLNPANNSNGPAFGLYVAPASNGPMIPLPLAVTALERFESNISSLVSFPNPVRETLNLEWTLNQSSEVRLEWFNLQGQLVRSEELGFLQAGTQTHRSNIADLSEGWYTLRVSDNNNTQSLMLQIRR